MLATAVESSEVLYEKIDAEIEVLDKEIEERGRDETGALREHLLHSQISELIDRSVKFSPEGVEAREGCRDSYIVAVTAVDLQKANSTQGHKLGDTLLRKSVGEAGDLLGEGYDRFRVYHNGGMDFTCIANGADVEYKAFELENKPVLIDGQEYNLSVSFMSVDTVVEYYNNFISQYEIRATGADLLRVQKRLFTEIAIRAVEHSREIKKLTDMAAEFVGSPEVIESRRDEFNMHVKWMFRGTRFEDIEGFMLRDGETYAEASNEFFSSCLQIADRNVLGNGKEFKSRWREVLNPIVKSLAEEQDEFNIPVETGKTPNMDLDEFSKTVRTEKASEFERVRDLRQRLLYHTQEGLAAWENTREYGKAGDLEKEAERAVNSLGMLINYASGLSPYSETYMYFFQELQKREYMVSRDAMAEWLTDRGKAQQYYSDMKVLMRIQDAIGKKIDLELTEYDRMTGLKNKTAYSERIVALGREFDTDFQVVALDLGFLKYFNKEAHRRVGDSAIQAAAVILQRAAEKFPGQVEIFRTGGDEFNLIVKGSEELTINLLQEIDKVTEEVGPVPTDENNLGKYTPEEIQFNKGYCTRIQARAALEILKDPDSRAFHPSDIKHLSVNDSDYEPEFYTRTLANIQNMIADMSIDEQKLTSRAAFLKKVLENGLEEHFRVLYPYSGKALQGVTSEQFYQTYVQYEGKSEEEFIDALRRLSSTEVVLSPERDNILNRVVAAMQAEYLFEHRG